MADDPVETIVTDDPSRPPAEGTGLCLSGGGYRAMVFHLGALWRLYECGLLKDVRRVSSVSGGSITAAVLALAWRRLSFDPARLQSIGLVFALDIAVFAVTIGLSALLFSRRFIPEAARRTALRFGTTYSNAGFLGIPLAQALLGDRPGSLAVAHVHSGRPRPGDSLLGDAVCGLRVPGTEHAVADPSPAHALHALAEAHEIGTIWPGHGPVIVDALGALDFYIAHRQERLAQVEAAVAQLRERPHPEGIAAEELPRQVVEIVYQDVDPVLWGAAELSVRAQLAYLAERG